MRTGDINILMTGAGAPGAAGILKCLGKETSFNVFTADADPDALGQHLSKDFSVVPPGDDPNFIPAILDTCRKKNIHIVMPLVTRELLPLAVHREELEFAGAKVLVSPAESIGIALDKGRTYQFLEWRGIPVPGYRIIAGSGELEPACLDLGYPERPVVIKPCLSNGSRGFRVISEKIDRLDQFLNQKPGNFPLSLAEIKQVLGKAALPELLISEYLPGDEYSVDCLCRNGEALLILPRRRIKMINGISVKGEFIQDEQIINYCHSIIRELRLHGNVGFQVKANERGQYLLLEINPRVQGSISAALGAGVNLPALAVRSELGLSFGETELRVKWGTRFARYWQEVFY